MMNVSQVRSRWLLPLFQLLDFDPVYLRGDTVLDEAGKLRYPLSHRGWEGEDAPISITGLSTWKSSLKVKKHERFPLSLSTRQARAAESVETVGR